MKEFESTKEGGKRRKGDLDNPSSDEDENEGAEKTVELRMPGSSPTHDDDYFCTAFNISKITGGKRVFVTGVCWFLKAFRGASQ